MIILSCTSLAEINTSDSFRLEKYAKTSFLYAMPLMMYPPSPNLFENHSAPSSSLVHDIPSGFLPIATPRYAVLVLMFPLCASKETEEKDKMFYILEIGVGLLFISLELAVALFFVM